MLCQHIYGARNTNTMLADALILESARGIIEHLDIDGSEGLLDKYNGLFARRSSQSRSLSDFFKNEVHSVELAKLVDFFEFQGLGQRSQEFRQPSALYFTLDRPHENISEEYRSINHAGGIIVDGKNVAAWAYGLK